MATLPIGHTISLLTGILERNGVRVLDKHYPVAEHEWGPPSISVTRLTWDSPGKGKDPALRYGFGSSYRSKKLSRLKSLSEAVEAYCTFSSTLTPHTVGISAGWKKEAVILNAMCELVEKEACILSFLLKLPLKRIDPSSEARLHRHFTRYRNSGLLLHSYKIRNTFDVPVYMSILEDRSGKGPAVAVGAKAHFDEREALMNSIEEAAMIHVTYRSFSRHRKTVLSLPVTTPPDRSAFWAKREHLEKLSFLIEAPYEKIDFTRRAIPPRDAYEHMVRLLDKQHIRWHVFELTPPFMKDVGYRVYQVLMPDLQQFYFDDTKKDIKTARAKNMARLYRTKMPRLNTDPHPFV